MRLFPGCRALRARVAAHLARTIRPDAAPAIAVGLAVVLLMTLGLGGCGANQSESEQGFVDQFSRQHQQVARDVEAILQGMNQARAQHQRLAGRAPESGPGPP